MIQSTEVKPNSYFVWEGTLYQCIEKSLNKTAMAKMKVAIKVKDVMTGVVKELSLIGSDRVEEAYIDRKEMQYLYDDGANLVFMDTETYEQLEIPSETVTYEKQFMKEEMLINITMYQGKLIGVALPDKVVLRVAEAEEAVKGNTATSANKYAVLETGLQIKVPLFIKAGELVEVSTIDASYSGRAKAE